VGSRAAAAARALGASGYTIGNQVAFARSPDLRTAAHEAAHAVQQRAGVQMSGDVGLVGDVYERHADQVAEAAAQGRSAESILDRMVRAGLHVPGARRAVIQRKVSSDWGEFDTTTYSNLPAGAVAGTEYGVDITLSFDPDTTKVDASRIALTQSVRSQLAGAGVAIEPSRHTRVVPSGTGAGREIDRTTSGAYANPLYAADVPGAKDKLGDTPAVAGWGKFGYNYKNAAGTKYHGPATLIDQPSLPGRGNNAGQIFETAALAVAGKQTGTYMGSVSWGWSTDGAGKFSREPLTLVSKGKPSTEFVEAAKQWNKWTTAGTTKTTPDPTNVYDAAYSVAFTVAKDTTVTLGAGSIHADTIYQHVDITSGPKAGSSGLIKVDDLRDVGGGTAAIHLPIP
jgi:hypothetical protein